MKHLEVRDQLVAYLEGDLDLEERAEVDAHLEECRICSLELAELRATVTLVRGLPDPDLPDALSDTVMERVRRERSGGRLIRATFGRLAEPRVVTALAAGLAGLAVLLAYDQGRLSLTIPLRSPLPQAGGEQVASMEIGAKQRSAPAGRTTAERPAPGRLVPVASSPFVDERQLGAEYARIEPPPGLALQLERVVDGQVERQVQRLIEDPESFLDRMEAVSAGYITRMLRHAAERGSAPLVAERLQATQHPLGRHLAARFLEASIAYGFEQGGESAVPVTTATAP